MSLMSVSVVKIARGVLMLSRLVDFVWTLVFVFVVG